MVCKFHSGFLLSLAFGAGIGACGNAKAVADAAEESYTILRADDLKAGEFAHLTTISLGGGDSSGFVNNVTDMDLLGDSIYVLDAFDRMVKVFSGDGHFLFRFGHKGEGPGEFIDPFDIEIANDQVLVADPGRGRAINVFTLSGKYFDLIEVETPRTQTAFEPAIDKLYILTPAIRFPEREGWNILTVATREGRILSTGCRLDPRYIASARRNGTIHRNQYGKVRIFDGSVYCSQTISPVIQVMDSLGSLIDSIAVAPPFYAAPTDREFIPNQKEIFDWFSEWTIHNNFWPVAGGWISSYNTFDPGRGEMVYSLFACRYAPSQPVCTVIDDVPRPLLATGFGRIYVMEEIAPRETVRLGVYKLTF